MGTGRAARLRRGLAAAGRRRALPAAAAAAALLAAGALALQLGGPGDRTAAAPAAGAGGATGKVERRTLAERLTATGTIGYAGETTVLARLAGTVTALPGVGDRIGRGEQLYAVGGEPVLLMYGGVPAYRGLAEGVDEGADVEQLEENLAALGYEPGTVDEEFTSATATAVSAWQDDAGLEATGEVELGRVVFLPGPRRVTEVLATLGEAIGSGGGGGLAAAQPEETTTTLVAYEVGTAEEAPEGEAAGGDPAEPDAEEAEPKEQREAKAQEQAPPSAPAEESSAPSGVGAEAAEPDGRGEAPDPASVPILKTSSTERVVSVELDPDQQSVARRGQRVEVLLPGDDQVRGEVRRIAVTEVGGEGLGEETEPGLEVTVSLLGSTKVPALEGAAVSVLFIQNVREDVLSVPLTALVAIGGTRFAVVAVEGTARRRIVVTPGLAADGYVEVEGAGLRAGMTVETGG